MAKQEQTDLNGAHVVLTAFYKRHELTKLCYTELARQKEKFGFEVVAVGSEDKSSRKIAESFNFDYVEHENTPLGKKFNAGLKHIMDKYTNFGGVIVMGSDNIAKDELFEKYVGIDGNRVELYGPAKMVYFSTRTYRSSIVELHETWGAGRLYTKALIQKLQNKLWSDKINKGLDTFARGMCERVGCEMVRFEDPIVLDIKHELNLTSHKIVDAGRFLKEANAINMFPIIEQAKKLIAPKEPTQIRMGKNKNKNMARVKYLKDAAGIQKGTEKTLRYRIAVALEKEGIIKILRDNKEEKETVKEVVKETKKESVEETVIENADTGEELIEAFEEVEEETETTEEDCNEEDEECDCPDKEDCGCGKTDEQRYMEMKNVELKEICKERGYPIPHNARKAELVALILRR